MSPTQPSDPAAPSGNTLNVYLTVDVEVWTDGWKDMDGRFADCFRRYVYGPTPEGDFALPYLLHTLRSHRLRGVFFVEPLFSGRFGQAALDEIVALVLANEQEVQLHLHPEWQDKALAPVVPHRSGRNMAHFTAQEQSLLVREGLGALKAAGAPNVNAFRAGGFCRNAGTLEALAANNIQYDSSYNPLAPASWAGLPGSPPCSQPLLRQAVVEVPISAFVAPGGGIRHAQIGACSLAELIGLLEHAYAARWGSVVLLSHNFELLSPDKRRVDCVVRRRWDGLCRYLDEHRERLRTAGFLTEPPVPATYQPPLPRSTVPATARRHLEQATRRLRNAIRLPR